MAKYLDFNGLKRFKNKLSGIFQSKLVSGTNIKTINNNSVLGSGDLTIDIPTKTSDLINDSGFVDKDVNNLTHYTLAVDSGSFIDLDINSTTYVVTLSLKNSSGTVISSDSIDLPLESVVVNGSYDSTNKKIILTLQSGSTIDIPVGDLISGLQTEITSSNKLASDLVDDTNQVNKFVSTTEKNTWNAKQDALVSGTNIKTINNESILGLGDIDTSVSWGDIDGTLSDQSDLNSAFNSKQDALISGTNIKTINNESILGSGDISILYDAPIYYIDTNSSSNPFYFCGKKKGLYFFNRSIFSVYYTFDETTHVISEPLGLAHYIAVLNDIPEDVADGTVLAYYVKYSGVNDRYIDYPVTVARQNPGLYNTGLNITSYSARSYVSLDTAQTISSKKTFSTLPESSIVPTTNNQLVNKKYVDNSFFDIVAPEYSSSATYDVGDFVIHEGLMYTCNTAISTAEAWDSTHWTQTSVNENFGGGSTPLDDIPTFDFTSCIWPAYSWTSGRYAPRGATFLKSTARVLYESFVEVVSTGKKTFIGYTGIGEYPFIYPWINNYSYYVNRAASSTVTYVFELPIRSPKVSNSRPLVSGYVTAFFQVKYDENKDFIEISTNPYPQWWYQNSAYAVATLTGNFHYTIGSTSSDQYSLVYRKYVEDNFLSKVNTTSYTPTTNYNPATKKYVDDLMANIAPIYSSSSTYDVGDYVVYLGLLYKCNTTISTAESWDPTHWDRTTVVDILSNS